MLTSRERQRRVLVLDALDRRIRQFRARDGAWPFRLPNDPIDLESIVSEALGEPGTRLSHDALRTRSVLRLTWSTGDEWELWAIALPSGLQVYCDGDADETRVLASARRGNPSDADGFFLERLAETHGQLFGIEMAGAPPERVRSSIGDRAFLAEVFVDLFEGTDAEPALRADPRSSAHASDFHAVVAAWLDRVLSAPPAARRQRRVRDEDPSLST
ncbi:MAG TPA: hypothetical protein VGI12_01515 [Vicinamibacterales bacterium]